MKQKKKKRKGVVNGYALLYGQSSRAIRIVHGEIVGRVKKKEHPSGRHYKMVSGPQKTKRIAKNNVCSPNPVQKKYRMDEDTKKRIDNLQDPLEMLSRSSRAQKYEAANSTEKYEYGLSDW